MQFNNPILQLARGEGNVMQAIQQIAQFARSGGNVIQAMQEIVGYDNRIAQAYSMLQGKNALQLQQIAENMARQSGTNVGNILRGLRLM